VHDALLASKLVSYAQGFMLMRAANDEYGWRLDLGRIALLWRAGCIIRSSFLGRIRDAYEHDADLASLLLDPWFRQVVERCQNGWRRHGDARRRARDRGSRPVGGTRLLRWLPLRAWPGQRHPGDA
jgi:6-phosphogluconate dehydrogenase